MSPSFNLVDEPWLPCIRLDGTPVNLGLYDVLAQAPGLRELQGETPLGTAALHRLLLAVLHRNFGPAGRPPWQEMWKAGHWDAALLQDYFARWHGRFDLFDEDHPFFQAPDAPGEPRPLNRLSLPHAFNSTLFQHEMADGSLVVPAARAAEWLVTLQAASIGTGPPFNPYPAGPLVNSLLVMPQGRTLFETLMLNLIEYRGDKPMPAPRDRQDKPAWEQDRNPFPPGPATFYLPGYLEYLTWQNRTVRLLPWHRNGSLEVRECKLSQGARWNNRLIQDPMKVYSMAKKEEMGMLPLRLTEDKSMWRDAHALFRLHDGTVRPPLSFSWLAGHVLDGVLERSQVYDYAAFGLCNDNARLDFFRHERMPLPLAYLGAENEELAEALRDALAAAEGIARALYFAGQTLARCIVSPVDPSKAHKDDVRPVYARLGTERLYWSRLEVPFQRLVAVLPGDRQAAIAAWSEALLRAARQAFSEAAGDFRDAGRGLKALVLARDTLESELARVMTSEKEVG